MSFIVIDHIGTHVEAVDQDFLLKRVHFSVCTPYTCTTYGNLSAPYRLAQSKDETVVATKSEFRLLLSQTVLWLQSSAEASRITCETL